MSSRKGDFIGYHLDSVHFFSEVLKHEVTLMDAHPFKFFCIYLLSCFAIWSLTLALLLKILFSYQYFD